MEDYSYLTSADADLLAPGIMVIGYLIYLVISSALPMIISGILAKKKGKSVGLWVFLGFLIGWIAVIIVALSSPEQPNNNYNNYNSPYNPNNPYGGGDPYNPNNSYGNNQYNGNGSYGGEFNSNTPYGNNGYNPSANNGYGGNNAYGNNNGYNNSDAFNPNNKYVGDDVNNTNGNYNYNGNFDENSNRTNNIDVRAFNGNRIGDGWTCINCGSLNPANSKFCGNCGTGKSDKELG